MDQRNQNRRYHDSVLHACGECSCFCCCMSRARCRLVTKGVFARLLFIAYIFLCLVLSIIVFIETSFYYPVEINVGAYLIAAIAICVASLVAIIIESCVTLCCKRHGDWKLFSPIMFMFLVGSVPQLFLLESVLISMRKIQLPVCIEDTGMSFDACFEQICSKSELYKETELFERSLLAFEQTLVIVLVLGRWLLPRGKMTREKLSDMLFAYMGMALDILEFLQSGLRHGEVACNRTYALVVLSIVTVSLFPFVFDLDLFIGMYHMKKRLQKRQQKPANPKASRQDKSKLIMLFKNTEARTIIMNMCLQEASLLSFRLYSLAVFDNDVDDQQSLIFFMIKNIIVLALQTYRLGIILRNVRISPEDLDKMIDAAGMIEIPLDEDFVIRNDDIELVLTVDQKRKPQTISIGDLKKMIKEYTSLDKQLLMNADINISADKILSLREKNDADKIQNNSLIGIISPVFDG